MSSKEELKSKIPGEQPDVKAEGGDDRDRPVAHTGPAHRAEEKAVGGAEPPRSLESREEGYEGHGFPGMDADQSGGEKQTNAGNRAKRP